MTDEFNQYVCSLINKKLWEMEELFQEHFDEYKPIFQQNFQRICENIIQLQKSGELKEISYLEYTLLHTDFVQKKETSQVRVYDRNWYFDCRQRAVGDFDLTFLFVKYSELWTELMASRKRYAGMVTAQEITSYMLLCAKKFYQYVVFLCRYSILPCVDAEPFQSIKRAKEFEINVGEYMACTESVYKENRIRTSKDTLEWFSQRWELKYTYEDFCGLDFTGAELSDIDLRYSDLRRTRLVNTDFQGAWLHGTRFCHASMQGANLRRCFIHGADFTGANLSNACFCEARAYSGAAKQLNWACVGYHKVSFQDANLTNADFRETAIYDADFTGAIMDGAVINKKELERFELSPQQKQVIRLVDECKFNTLIQIT